MVYLWPNRDDLDFAKVLPEVLDLTRALIGLFDVSQQNWDESEIESVPLRAWAARQDPPVVPTDRPWRSGWDIEVVYGPIDFLVEAMCGARRENMIAYRLDNHNRPLLWGTTAWQVNLRQARWSLTRIIARGGV